MPKSINTLTQGNQAQSPAISDIQKSPAQTMPAGVNVSSDTPASNSQLTIDRYEITDIHSNLQCACTGVYQSITALSLAKHATTITQIQSLVNIAIDSLLANHGVLDYETERLTSQIEGGI